MIPDVQIWYRVDVPPAGRRGGFVCGVGTDDAGTVVNAAPIMRWTIGRDIDRVANWVLARGGTIEPLDVVAL